MVLCLRKKERRTPVSMRALRGHSVNEDHRIHITNEAKGKLHGKGGVQAPRSRREARLQQLQQALAGGSDSRMRMAQCSVVKGLHAYINRSKFRESVAKCGNNALFLPLRSLASLILTKGAHTAPPSFGGRPPCFR